MLVLQVLVMCHVPPGHAQADIESSGNNGLTTFDTPTLSRMCSLSCFEECDRAALHMKVVLFWRAGWLVLVEQYDIKCRVTALSQHK